MPRAPARRRSRSRSVGAVASWVGVVLTVASACSPGGTEDTARIRGDLAFARDSLELALAEYRLSVRQGSDDGLSLGRVAHTYLRMGRVDEARDWYRRAVAADPTLQDQAAAELLNHARDAVERGDRFQMASAMDAGLSFRPGMAMEAMALPMARHHFENGEYGRALPFYEKAMAVAGDSVPDLLFEIGQAHEEIGDCRRALVYFERFREMVEPWERSEVDWYIGSCSFRLASELLAGRAGTTAGDRAPGEIGEEAGPDAAQGGDERRGGVGERRRDPSRRGERITGGDQGGSPDPDEATSVSEEVLREALSLIRRTIEVGEPRNLMSSAWFEEGEILSRLGDCDGALAAFEEVFRTEASPNTALARRAQERFDEIKFGRGLQTLRPGRGCG